jgi:hypothetical protein
VVGKVIRSSPQESIFCERPAEMRVLQQAFERAMSGHETQVVAVVGNSGLGKTRLVMEFFRWLSKTYDGGARGGYWPDSLATEGRNLLVNPRFEECNTSVLPPFFWTGMRFPDPLAKNAGFGSVLQYGAASFAVHLHELLKYRQLNKPGDKIKSVASSVTADFLTDKVFDYAVDLIPIPGMKVMLSVAKAVYGQLKQNENEETLYLSADKRFRASETSVASSWLDALSNLYSVEAQEQQIQRLGYPLGRPLILFVDDAQWAWRDATLIEFLEELLSNSAWPILVVVTCWEVDWNKKTAIRRVLEHNPKVAVNVMKLRPHRDLSPLLESALPGINEAHRQIFLQKAGGNPAALQILIGGFKNRARNFENLDILGPLSKVGDEKLRDAEVVSDDIRKLAESVLGDAGQEIRWALAVSAWQGIRFLPSLTESSRAVLAKVGNVRDAIARAHDPYAFIELDGEFISEFAQRIYWEVARESVADNLTEADQTTLLDSLPSKMLQLLDSEIDQAAKLTCCDIALNLLETSTAIDAAYLVSRAALELSNGARRRYDFQAAASYAETFYRIFLKGTIDVRLFDKFELLFVSDSLEYANVEAAADLLVHIRSVKPPSEDLRYYAAVLGQAARVARKMGSSDAYDLSLQCSEAFSTIYRNVATAEAGRDLAVAFGLVADLAILNGQQDEARHFAELAIPLVCANIETSSPQELRDASHAYARLSRTVLPFDPDAAGSSAQQAIQFARAGARNSSGPYVRRDLALALLAVIDSELAQGHVVEARESMSECRDIFTTLLKSSSWTAHRDMALALWRSSRIYEIEGDHRHALADLDESLTLLAKSRGPQGAIERLVTLRRAEQLADRCDDYEAGVAYNALAHDAFNQISRAGRLRMLRSSQLDTFEDLKEVEDMLTMSPSLATRWFHKSSSFREI